MSLFQIKENIVSLYLNPLMFRSHGYIREMLLLDVLMKEKPKDNISGLACHDMSKLSNLIHRKNLSSFKLIKI